MYFFDVQIPPEEEEVARELDRKGGIKKVRSNEDDVKELNDFATKLTGRDMLNPMKEAKQRPNKWSPNFRSLMGELNQDFETSLANHMEAFNAKLEIGRKALVQELTEVVKSEVKGVKERMQEPMHERVIDPVRI